MCEEFNGDFCFINRPSFTFITTDFSPVHSPRCIAPATGTGLGRELHCRTPDGLKALPRLGHRVLVGAGLDCWVAACPVCRSSKNPRNNQIALAYARRRAQCEKLSSAAAR